MKDLNTIFGRNILFLGCHLDDVEFGCGAFLSRCARSKENNIRVEVLSNHNENARNEIQLVRDVQEFDKAMNILGVKKNSCYMDNIPGQRFDSYRQEIRELLLRIGNDFHPDTVFFPALDDIHQDHAVLAEESFRIFRNINCLGYEVIRSARNFIPNFYVDISQEEMMRKIHAIMSYKSQIEQSSAYYFDENIVKSIAVFRGAQMSMSFAEAFSVYKYGLQGDGLCLNC